MSVRTKHPDPPHSRRFVHMCGAVTACESSMRSLGGTLRGFAEVFESLRRQSVAQEISSSPNKSRNATETGWNALCNSSAGRPIGVGWPTAERQKARRMSGIEGFGEGSNEVQRRPGDVRRSHQSNDPSCSSSERYRVGSFSTGAACPVQFPCPPTAFRISGTRPDASGEFD